MTGQPVGKGLTPLSARQVPGRGRPPSGKTLPLASAPGGALTSHWVPFDARWFARTLPAARREDLAAMAARLDARAAELRKELAGLAELEAGVAGARPPLPACPRELSWRLCAWLAVAPLPEAPHSYWHSSADTAPLFWLLCLKRLGCYFLLVEGASARCDQLRVGLLPCFDRQGAASRLQH